MCEDTIAAIATPLGVGSIGVVRISGENALSIADKVFKSANGKKITELSGYSALYGEFYDDGNRIDNGVALVFKAPKSYTGEDVVELSSHGGTLIIKQLLRACLNSGARLAGAGEFTKRAFLNNKLDLIKAESVMGLIGAQSESELRLINSAHTGRTSQKMEAIKNDLLGIAASICVLADYPDEDIPSLEINALKSQLDSAKTALENTLKEYDLGKILREGISTAIVGKPNVGKSTLMNLLSGQRRSIVTDIAGTTRDIIEDTVILGDITLHLADTAGIRKTDDTVENLGVELALDRINTAQLILAVFDASDTLDENDKTLLENIENKTAIVILNKCDKQNLLTAADFGRLPVIPFSAKNGDGLDTLTKKVSELCGTNHLSADAAVLISERQRECASRALNAIIEASNTLGMGFTYDAVGICIDDAIAALLELSGERVTSEVTNEIFKSFCVGK